MNFLSFDHENKKSWLDIAPDLAQPLKMNDKEIPLNDPVMLHTTDERANFIIGSLGEELDMKRKMYDEKCRPDYDRFDYNIADKNNKEISDHGNKIDHTPPMSFFAIDNVADGIAWYRERYPEMPDIVIETCAREKWGKIPKNRKEIRAEKQQRKKEEKKELRGLEIKRKEVSLDFN